jgi:hypothetical protein
MRASAEDVDFDLISSFIRSSLVVASPEFSTRGSVDELARGAISRAFGGEKWRWTVVGAPWTVVQPCLNRR